MHIKYICLRWVCIIILILSINLLSQNIYQVTDEAEGITDFVWSPDGSQFAYTTDIDDTSRLFLINIDGNNRVMLTNSRASGRIDWKGSVITFQSNVGPDYYDGIIKRINPDGSDEMIIVGPNWLHHPILRADGNWLLYSDGPYGWWQARRCDLNGDNNLILETDDLVQQVGWFGNGEILYSRGTNFNTVCAIHKIGFNGENHVQLTSQTLPNNALFIATADTAKILYCDGTADNWDIWIMDPDGNNKTQLTTDTTRDYLSNTRDNVCSIDGKSFFFTSNRSGAGDIYRLNIDGTKLVQMTNHDSVDYNPIPSPDGKFLAFISNRDAVNNIWLLKLYPERPLLAEPANGSTGLSTNPILNWNRSPRAVSYGLQVSTTNNFSTTVFNISGIIDSSWQLSDLDRETIYYWRINATNEDGTSEWSDTWNFMTEINIPSKPTLVSPLNGSTDIATNPTLSWNILLRAESYGLQVSTLSSFSTTIFDEGGLTDSSQQINGLNEETTYYWRVNATNITGTSVWSDTWNFTTEKIINIPSIPTLVAPSNGASGIPTGPNLNWNASTGANSYALQISALSDFSTTIYNQTGLTGNNLDMNGLDEKTTYYWRVNATNNTGTSSWSDIWHFTTEIITGVTKVITLTGTAQNAYRIISIPVDADKKEPTEIFSDFGKYDKTKWRLFELRDDQQYYEYSHISELLPGMGYWLITKMSDKEINTGAGKTVATNQPYSIKLNEGWTLIGNPFIFSVPINHLTLANEAPLNILEYNGDWEDFNGSLLPFRGYLIGSESETDLLVNPGIINSQKIAYNSSKIALNDPPLWEVSIHARCQKARDTYTVFGVCENASIDLDRFDKAEPPVIGEYVSVYFPHEEWKTVFTKFAKDFRPANEKGYIWEFAVQTNIDDKVQLTFPDIDKISYKYDFWIFDEITKCTQNLNKTKHYEIAGDKNQRMLKLIVGNQDFIEGELSKLDLLPTTWILDQNFPNPFNPITTIRFGLPVDQYVTIKIYNILGQEINTIVNNIYMKAGYHFVIWDGKDWNDQSVASGIYIYSLSAVKYRSTKKMILVR